MNDLTQLVNEIRDVAEGRGLTILEAVFPGDPTFVLHIDATSVETALNLAQSMLAPFVSLTIDRFDADEFLAELDGEAPAAMVQLAREHHGEPQGLAMRWFGLGATALFLAGTDWSDELSGSRDEWAAERRMAWVDQRDSRAIRVAYLADQIELDPRYRAASQNQRTVVGRVVADELTSADDDATTVKWALERASRSVRENAASAYLALEEMMEAVADDLRDTEAWRKSRTAKEREATAREFMMQRTGYAPPATLTARLAREAFTWR